MTQKTMLPAENYVLLASFGGALVGSDPRREAVGQLLDGHGHLYGYGVKQEATETLRKAGLMDGRGHITREGLEAAERLLQGQEIPVKEAGAGAAVPADQLGQMLRAQPGHGMRLSPDRFVVLKSLELALPEGDPDRIKAARMTQGMTYTDQELKFAVGNMQSHSMLDRDRNLTRIGATQARHILQGLI